MSEKLFKEAIEAILKGDTDKATDVAKRGLDEGLDPLALMDQGFIPGINQVGDLFETGRLFLPQLVYSAMAMEKGTRGEKSSGGRPLTNQTGDPKAITVLSMPDGVPW